MDRDFSNDARTQSPETPARDVALQTREGPLSREPEPLRERGYVYSLSPAQRATLAEIGQFRAIDTRDLFAHRYKDGRSQGEDDLQTLAAQGLIERRIVRPTPKADPLPLVVLTKRGQEVADHHRIDHDKQRHYSGLVKPAEARHDAAIYPMFQAERRKIEAAGGQVNRVVLDYELKRNVFRPLAKARALPPSEYARRQGEIARENGLRVVGRKILLPDLRIEYTTRTGAAASVDLELATEHYRGAMMRGKAAAGFKMYAPQQSMAGLTAAYDPELVAGIISL